MQELWSNVMQELEVTDVDTLKYKQGYLRALRDVSEFDLGEPQ